MSDSNGKATKVPSDKEICGIIMPISGIDSYSKEHWTEVYSILQTAIEKAGLRANLVSVTNEVNVIHNTIVGNISENPIVVCDVSGKNPNVMFELGLRLAFDMPVIVVKDDETQYSFDTSPIEHLVYPRSLRFQTINDFIEKLTGKVADTLARSKTDSEYSPFLKHFHKIKLKRRVSEKEVSSIDFILQRLDSLGEQMAELKFMSRSSVGSSFLESLSSIEQTKPRRPPTLYDLGENFLLTFDPATVPNDLNSLYPTFIKYLESHNPATAADNEAAKRALRRALDNFFYSSTSRTSIKRSS